MKIRSASLASREPITATPPSFNTNQASEIRNLKKKKKGKVKKKSSHHHHPSTNTSITNLNGIVKEPSTTSAVSRSSTATTNNECTETTANHNHHRGNIICGAHGFGLNNDKVSGSYNIAAKHSKDVVKDKVSQVLGLLFQSKTLANIS